jgi:hypothetical protein
VSIEIEARPSTSRAGRANQEDASGKGLLSMLYSALSRPFRTVPPFQNSSSVAEQRYVCDRGLAVSLFIA